MLVLLFIGGGDGRSTRGRGAGCRGGGYPLMEPEELVGSDPAIVPGGAVEVVVAVPGSVKAVVVSTFVAVAAEVVIGAAVSPGAFRFAVPPAVEPSCTTS